MDRGPANGVEILDSGPDRLGGSRIGFHDVFQELSEQGGVLAILGVVAGSSQGGPHLDQFPIGCVTTKRRLRQPTILRTHRISKTHAQNSPKASFFNSPTEPEHCRRVW